MNYGCQSPQAVNNEHRWEYGYIRQGEEFERCMNSGCGEERFHRYHDVGSGC